MITHFTIHGDFITNHFRSIVLEGDWLFKMFLIIL